MMRTVARRGRWLWLLPRSPCPEYPSPQEAAMHQPPIPHVASTDPEIAGLIEGESQRQFEKIQLIPSENYCFVFLRDAAHTVLTNYYSEGYADWLHYEVLEIVVPPEELWTSP